MIYALVEGGNVTNVILWDGIDEFTISEGQTLVPATYNVAIGWTYVDGNFVAPESTDPPEIDTELETKLSAVAELVSKGFTESTARVIVGLPSES